MQTIARFVTRPSNDEGTECDLLLGTMMRNCGTQLKPNTVYEIYNCLGVLNIREVGESLLSKGRVDQSPIRVTWAQEYSDAAAEAGQYLLVTRKEYEQIIKQRRASDTEWED